ncbi:polysaccharide deacetylase family protein [Chishuiella sp.]|uniref:polysaccharide deacetylase family protein n=1 Tax=Chishuiella sp. TaxID=1969467 RepID=UPI0028B2098F|nr:polysaccharide deacetylase family protein [Chishuiella sp.]
MSKLPILMYHNITTDISKRDKLTVHKNLLEKQFKYLVKKNYKTHFLSELDHKSILTGKNIIITFDDVTKNQLEFAIPLLKKYNLKATFFIPFAYVGKYDEWNNSNEAIMSTEDLKSINNEFELAYHSFYHRKYSILTKEEIANDFYLSEKYKKENNIKLHQSLAYPYGNFPKKNPEKQLFFKTLKNNKMIYGLRIGNRINKFPFENPFEINRIDIKGNESFLKFIFKINFGKLF